MRIGRNDTSPFLHYFLSLARQHLAGHAQISQVLLGEIHRLLQKFQIGERNRRSGCFGSPVGISGNLVRDLSGCFWSGYFWASRWFRIHDLGSSASLHEKRATAGAIEADREPPNRPRPSLTSARGASNLS